MLLTTLNPNSRLKNEVHMKKIFVLFFLIQAAYAEINPPSFKDPGLSEPQFNSNELRILHRLYSSHPIVEISPRSLLSRSSSRGAVIDLTGYADSISPMQSGSPEGWR